MIFLKKNLFVFVFAAFATTACFSMETSTPATENNTPQDTLLKITNDFKQRADILNTELKQLADFIKTETNILTFDNNGIKIEILKLHEDPCFRLYNNHRISLRITNNTTTPIIPTKKLFKNIPQTSYSEIAIKLGSLLALAESGIAGSAIAISSFGMGALVKFMADTANKYFGNDKNYQPKDSYKDDIKPCLILGGVSAATLLSYLLYNLYNECKFREKIVEPTQSISFVTYISKSDFEKLEKGLLIPELDIKKAE